MWVWISCKTSHNYYGGAWVGGCGSITNEVDHVLILLCASMSILSKAAKSGRSSGSYCQQACMMPFISTGVSVGAGIR